MSGNCQNCKYRTSIPGNVHISCGRAFDADKDPFLGLLQLLGGGTHAMPIANKPVDFKIVLQDVPGGGAWPMNYNELCVVSCEGFEARTP